MLRSPMSRSVCSFIVKNLERLNGSLLYNGISHTGNQSERLISTIRCTNVFSVTTSTTTLPVTLYNYQPSREYAARKGTRARKEAKKVKKVVVKREFMFKTLRKQAMMPYKPQRPKDDSDRELPVDDVYIMRNFRAKRYPFEEAIQSLREGNHPTIANNPNGPVILRVNLDLKLPNRQTKCLDGWRTVIEMKRPFLLQGMILPSIMAFCMEDLDYIESVKKGGADIAGGKELIKAIQAGEINADGYEYIVAHPSIVPDLTAIRGLIKKKFPAVKNRTISPDLTAEIQRLKAGIKIQVVSDDREPDFGYIETPIGTLNMDGLVENYQSILSDVLRRCPKNKALDAYLIGCELKSVEPYNECFRLDVSPVLEEFEKQNQKGAKKSEATEE